MPPWRDIFSSSSSAAARSQPSLDNQDIYLPAPSRLDGHGDPAYSSIPPLGLSPDQRSSPHRSRATHGRSLSQTLQSTFASRKREELDESEHLSRSNHVQYAYVGNPHRTAASHKTQVEEEFDTGRCATCDTKVKWPKGLADFRCSTCLMINDTKPSPHVARVAINDTLPTRDRTGSDVQGERRVPLQTEQVNQISHRCVDAFLAIQPQSLLISETRSQRPITPLDHTNAAIARPVRKLTLSSTEASESQAIHQNPPDDSVPSGAAEHDSIFNALDSHVDLWADRPTAIQDVTHAANAIGLMQTFESSNVPTAPKRKPPPPPNLPQNSHHEPKGSNKTTTVHARINRQPSPSGARPLKSSQSPMGGQTQEKDRNKAIRSVFKPLEDYVVDTFANYECMNLAFLSTRPKLPAGLKSEEDTRPRQPERLAVPVTGGPAFPDVDAKTLLLGDVAENGLWWTGKDRRARSHSRLQPRRRSTDRSVSIVSSKSPHINWADLNICYSALLDVGKDWKSELKTKLAGGTPAFVNQPSEIEDTIDSARLHVHKTILKSSESLLKRPGRPLKEPDDIRFLLILLADPLLYPPTSPPFLERHDHMPSTRQTAVVDATRLPAIEAPKPSPGESAWERGHAYGVIKRILGLLSNMPEECHRYLTSWLSKFDEQRFCAVTDLILGFINHRMRRQSTRKPQTNANSGSGLIPTLSSSAANTSAQLNAAIGLGPTPHKKPDNKKALPIYGDDWQIKAAARVLSLVFAANKRFYQSHTGEQTNKTPKVALAGPVSRDHIKNHGQLLSTSYFYNSMVDYVDVVADFETWENMPDRFSFCQFPFLLSVRAKIKILEHDARRQMDLKAREAFFDNLLKNKQLEQFITFRVRRECLVEDSLKSIGQVVGTAQDEFKKELKIEFIGEEGIDVGGLRKEWFLSLVREIFDPDHGLFVYDDDSNFCYFNPYSFEASEQFHLVGALLGLAIYNGTILDVSLPPFLFKKLLSQAPAQYNKHIRSGMHLALDDLAELHPRLAKGLQQLLDYDGDVESTFCRDFTIDVERYGVTEHVTLGRDPSRPVTNSNRQEFVDLYIRYLLDTQVSRQFEPFKRGFFTVCGGNALSLFQPEEIELLVRGSDERLDVLSLKAVAVYENFRRGEHSIDSPDDLPLIQWFWESFEKASPKDQRSLLSFVTGSDRIPAAGVTNLKFKIGFAGKDHTRFPIARTCFNSILLYKYRDYKELERMLWTAVRESEGFGLK